MLPERDLGYLDDIRAYAMRVLSYTEDITFDAFAETTTLQDAVVRCLIVIGEAAARLTDAARAEFVDLDWKAMIGMRNVLAHDYGRVDLRKVWSVVEAELPGLA